MSNIAEYVLYRNYIFFPFHLNIYPYLVQKFNYFLIIYFLKKFIIYILDISISLIYFLVFQIFPFHIHVFDTLLIYIIIIWEKLFKELKCSNICIILLEYTIAWKILMLFRIIFIYKIYSIIIIQMLSIIIIVKKF